MPDTSLVDDVRAVFWVSLWPRRESTSRLAVDITILTETPQKQKRKKKEKKQKRDGEEENNMRISIQYVSVQ